MWSITMDIYSSFDIEGYGLTEGIWVHCISIRISMVDLRVAGLGLISEVICSKYLKTSVIYI